MGVRSDSDPEWLGVRCDSDPEWLGVRCDSDPEWFERLRTKDSLDAQAELRLNEIVTFDSGIDRQQRFQKRKHFVQWPGVWTIT